MLFLADNLANRTIIRFFCVDLSAWFISWFHTAYFKPCWGGNAKVVRLTNLCECDGQRRGVGGAAYLHLDGLLDHLAGWGQQSIQIIPRPSNIHCSHPHTLCPPQTCSCKHHFNFY